VEEAERLKRKIYVSCWERSFNQINDSSNSCVCFFLNNLYFMARHQRCKSGKVLQKRALQIGPKGQQLRICKKINTVTGKWQNKSQNTKK